MQRRRYQARATRSPKAIALRCARQSADEGKHHHVGFMLSVADAHEGESHNLYWHRIFPLQELITKIQEKAIYGGVF
jgi:hypothetical protein